MNNLDFNFFCKDCRQSREYREANCFVKYRIRRYEKGDYIGFKGELVKELSIVVEGAINVSFVLDSGLVMRSVDHPAPAPIGAVAIFSKSNRYMVDTKAIEACTIISVERDEITAQMSRCQDFMIGFIDYSASRVDVLAKHLAVLTQRSIRSKLAYYILMRTKGGRYQLGRRIGMLADYLCVERPSLSRVLGMFVEEDLITYSRGGGEVLDERALREMIA